MSCLLSSLEGYWLLKLVGFLSDDGYDPVCFYWEDILGPDVYVYVYVYVNN